MTGPTCRPDFIFPGMPACIFYWKHVSIITHKQPEKKLIPQQTAPSVPCPCSTVIGKRGDSSTFEVLAIKRGRGVRSETFKKGKRQ